MGAAGTRARAGSARAGGGGGGGRRRRWSAEPEPGRAERSAAQRAGERLARPRPRESSGIRPGGLPRHGEHRGTGEAGLPPPLCVFFLRERGADTRVLTGLGAPPVRTKARPGTRRGRALFRPPAAPRRPRAGAAGDLRQGPGPGLGGAWVSGRPRPLLCALGSGSARPFACRVGAPGVLSDGMRGHPGHRLCFLLCGEKGGIIYRLDSHCGV